MPPKKRKASASVEKSEAAPTKKLTKKELRAQAILRAKQSMQADKERVESVKAKKQQEAEAETRPSKRRKVQPVEEKKKVEKSSICMLRTTSAIIPDFQKRTIQNSSPGWTPSPDEIHLWQEIKANID